MAQNGEIDEEAEGKFRVKPPPEDRFNQELAKLTIQEFLNDELNDKSYSKINEDNEKLCTSMANSLKSLLKSKISSNYKLIVRIVMGQQRGAGVRVVARCLWDSASDAVASASYENESLFCVAVLFAIYSY